MTLFKFLAAVELPFMVEASPRVRNTVKFDHSETVDFTNADGARSADSVKYAVYRQVQVVDEAWIDENLQVHVYHKDYEETPHGAAVALLNLLEEANRLAAYVGKEFTFDIDRVEGKFESFLTNATAAATQSRPISVWADKDNTFDAFDVNGEKVTGKGQSPTQYFIASSMVVVKVYWGAYEIEATVFGTPNEKQLVGVHAIFEKVERARQFQASRGRQVKVTKIGQTLPALW